MAILGLLPVILSDVVGRIFSDKNNINCGLASKKKQSSLVLFKDELYIINANIN